MIDPLRDEAAARHAFVLLCEEARRCMAAFEDADLPVPAPIVDLLAEALAADYVAPPSNPARPSFAGQDWIWLEAEAAYPRTLMMAVLKEAGGYLQPEQLYQRLQQLRPGTSRTCIAAIARARELVERTPGGFNLINPEQAPDICGDVLWGAASAFTLTEIASYRRRAIVHILQSVPGGLTKKEVAAQLLGCRWVNAPVNIDTLREDFDYLVNSNQIHLESQRWVATAVITIETAASQTETDSCRCGPNWILSGIDPALVSECGLLLR